VGARFEELPQISFNSISEYSNRTCAESLNSTFWLRISHSCNVDDDIWLVEAWPWHLLGANRATWSKVDRIVSYCFSDFIRASRHVACRAPVCDVSCWHRCGDLFVTSPGAPSLLAWVGDVRVVPDKTFTGFSRQITSKYLQWC